MSESSKISDVCKYNARYIFFAIFSQIIYFSHDICRISLVCKNDAIHGKIARVFSFIYYLQESRKLFFCRNFARYLLFARTSQDTLYLQEICPKSILCKNLASHLLFARTFQNIFFPQEFLNESNISKKLASCLFFARILQDDTYLQEKRKISDIWKNVARYLLFARTLPVMYYL